MLMHTWGINMKNKKVVKNILLFFGFAIIAIGNILIKELDNLDEVWVYNTVRCIANRSTTV